MFYNWSNTRTIHFQNGLTLVLKDQRIHLIDSEKKELVFGFENGKLTFLEKGSIPSRDEYLATLSTARNVINSIKVGDVIDYQPDKTTSTSWHVVHIDKEKDEILVTCKMDFEDIPTLLLTGKSGYKDGPKTLHEKCQKLYSSESKGIFARCLTLNDIFRILGKEFAAQIEQNLHSRDYYYQIKDSEIFQKLSDVLPCYIRKFWLATSIDKSNENATNLCMYVISSSSIATTQLYYSYNTPCNYTSKNETEFYFCPIIVLKSKNFNGKYYKADKHKVWLLN